MNRYQSYMVQNSKGTEVYTVKSLHPTPSHQVVPGNVLSGPNLQKVFRVAVYTSLPIYCSLILVPTFQTDLTNILISLFIHAILMSLLYLNLSAALPQCLPYALSTWQAFYFWLPEHPISLLLPFKEQLWGPGLGTGERKQQNIAYEKSCLHGADILVGKADKKQVTSM